MKSIIIKLRFAFLALKAVPKFNLGDVVWYRGQRWTIINWARGPESTLTRNTGNGFTESIECVPQKEFVKAFSLLNYIHSFRSIYRFYMGYWYDILIRRSLKVTFREPIHGWLEK